MQIMCKYNLMSDARESRWPFGDRHIEELVAHFFANICGGMQGSAASRFGDLAKRIARADRCPSITSACGDTGDQQEGGGAAKGWWWSISDRFGGAMRALLGFFSAYYRPKKVCSAQNRTFRWSACSLSRQEQKDAAQKIGIAAVRYFDMKQLGAQSDSFVAEYDLFWAARASPCS